MEVEAAVAAVVFSFSSSSAAAPKSGEVMMIPVGGGVHFADPGPAFGASAVRSSFSFEGSEEVSKLER